MARWPGVPDMYGWLRLDRRGQWLLIDRNRPDFDESLHGAGSPITSPPIVDFIGRNYQADAQGRWYWQNGPQRVFVDIDLAPLVLRVVDLPTGRTLASHTGYPLRHVESVQLSDDGDLFVLSDLGPGVIHDMDLAQLALGFEGDAPAWLDLDGQRHPIAPLDARMTCFDQRPRPG